MMEEKIKVIATPLLDWYRTEKRILPWREEVSPYRTWVSEIMLQQTRVAAALPYFERFMAALPDVQALAAVDDETLMKLWQGLGYYSRARNLKRAAQVITEQYSGVFPSDEQALRALPGIGDYPAGAIASIAFAERVPAVDGNVLRIMARLNCFYDNILADSTKKQLTAALKAAMPPEAGEFNQALMDLGAMICLPKNPACERCPIREHCEAYKSKKVEELPVREKNKTRRVEEKTVFILLKEGKAALCKRRESGLLAGLWEFPNRDGFMDEQAAASYLASLGFTVREWKRKLTARHLFTHIEWQMQGYAVEVQGTNEDIGFYDEKQFHARAIPGAFRKFVAATEEYIKE